MSILGHFGENGEGTLNRNPKEGSDSGTALSGGLKTQKQAQKLELGGFVRTLSDGRIEIDVQGDEQKVEQMLAWCQAEPQSSHIKT